MRVCKAMPLDVYDEPLHSGVGLYTHLVMYNTSLLLCTNLLSCQVYITTSLCMIWCMHI